MDTADQRPMVLTTVLGKDLFFLSMSGTEEVSRLFEYQVVALAEQDTTVAAKDLLGTEAKVLLQTDDGTPLRWFHGIVAAFALDGTHGRYLKFRLTLRPWLWLLTRTTDIRIFQKKTALEIVKAVFGEHTSSFADETTRAPATREYCVQYRETAFNFVSRLLEEEGISYYFRHSDGGHQLVLVDAANSLAPAAPEASVVFRKDEEGVYGLPALYEWRETHEIQPGKVVLGDWNFETPDTSLKSKVEEASWSHAEGKKEAYDHPAGYPVKADGDALAKRRLEEWESRFARYTARGNAIAPTTGFKLTLTEHPRADQNADYVVLQTRIDMELAGWESGGSGDGETETRFACSFVAQPLAAPLRPARLTRKPAVAGPQTAIVVGESGAEITVDPHGRVKVQFHWDRLGAKNQDSSCWVRVASPMAGNGWGFISVPRIGQEVVVDFLEGDPDRPLIVGRVYNAAQKTPYELAANATVTTFKSRSSAGGAAADFNELRFEDKKGSEYVLLHAQKDRLEFVENDLKSLITKNEHRTVKENRHEKIEGELHTQVVKIVKHKADDEWQLKAAKDVKLLSNTNVNLKAKENFLVETATKDIGLKSGQHVLAKSAQNVTIEGGMNVHVKGAMNVVVEAGTQLTLKAGAGSIVIEAGGVSITGPMVKINSGGSAGSGAGGSPASAAEPADPTAPTLPEDPLSHR